MVQKSEHNRRPGDPQLVSIVIPCYRGAEYLPYAIESCLRQTYKNMEIIVVDDASPDDCAEIARRYAVSDSRVRVIERPENGGVSKAFNTGFDAASGGYFTRLAQDDIFQEDAIQRMVYFLAVSPTLALIYCDFQVIDAQGAFVRDRRVPVSENALRFRNDIGLCVMWRRLVWETLGGFSSEFDTAEDFEYWLRIADQFSIGRCPGCTLMYVREHSDAGSNQYFQRQEVGTVNVLRLAAKQFNRNRRLQLNKGLAYAALCFATDYSIRGMHGQAVARIIKSFALWPIPFGREETGRRFVRAKILAVALKRWLRRSGDLGEA